MFLLLFVLLIPLCASLNDVCEQTLEPGNCTEPDNRFYFEKSSGHCKAFNYTGCNGNENNFPTLDSCQNTCVGPFRKVLTVEDDAALKIYSLNLKDEKGWDFTDIKIISVYDVVSESSLEITTPKNELSTTTTTAPPINSTTEDINASTMNTTEKTPSVNATTQAASVSPTVAITTEAPSVTETSTKTARVTREARMVDDGDDISLCAVPNSYEDASIARYLPSTKGKQIGMNFTSLLMGYDKTKSMNPSMVIEVELPNKQRYTVFDSEDYSTYVQEKNSWIQYSLYLTETREEKVKVIFTMKRGGKDQLSAISAIDLKLMSMMDDDHYETTESSNDSSTPPPEADTGLSTMEITLIVLLVLLVLFGIFISYRHCALLMKLGEFKLPPGRKGENFTNPVFSGQSER